MKDETRERISRLLLGELGITLEQAKEMDQDEFHKLIEKKSGRKMGWELPKPGESPSPDDPCGDSYLLESGHITTKTAGDTVDEIISRNRRLRKR